ncbi:MAG: hypothetical protein RIS47_1665 [Bacteroidota bacterium]|jgi:beta-galactosidase
MHKTLYKQFSFGTLMLFFALAACKTPDVRRLSFNDNWHFMLDADSSDYSAVCKDSTWRVLDLPHDWSIEGEFSEANPATVGGGALPGGVGWYRKDFVLSTDDATKHIFIDFDGVYCNSEVWINGHSLGKRPNGYISFRYELTPYLKPTGETNTIAVKVSNSPQPNSRWYSGSGIYRNVWLLKLNPVHIAQWGTYITTPTITEKQAEIHIETAVDNQDTQNVNLSVVTTILDANGKEVAKNETTLSINKQQSAKAQTSIKLHKPNLWSIESPYLYTAVTELKSGKEITDRYETKFGVRSFQFDTHKGFSLNGKSLKINGVCNHHDLGCLGTAVNYRALERQLEILKAMGCNGIRTSHNPPAPELLQLCDKMGFIVMDEAFDMWKKGKNPYDYSINWDKWHQTDLRDLILRDRNHPSVFIWSIGNEIPEQGDSTGITIGKELSDLIRVLDPTRPITSAMNEPRPYNMIYRSNGLDLVGYNYKHERFDSFPEHFPGKKFIATETVSALQTRGHYDQQSDSIRIWPIRWDLPFTTGNTDNTCSAYDNCHAPWGSTHEDTWKQIKKYPFLSGQFIWTGFDYLGEPTPYLWPSRSSYFGIIDLAGFPKDVYYMYQSEWTDQKVLHLLPHWNWAPGQTIDVWAYTNATEVELFLNGKSLGKRSKQGDDIHLMWRVNYQAGELKAIGTWGKETQTTRVRTAGPATTFRATPDRAIIRADKSDLSFVSIQMLDKDGNPAPMANNQMAFNIEGKGSIAGVDNGSPTSHESFKGNTIRAFNGKCLVVVRSNGQKGEVKLTISSPGIQAQNITIIAQ